ncbi:MAG: phosphoenolpyruvate synthase [Patescibacteria group bacterium]
MNRTEKGQLILWISEGDKNDSNLVGKKAANLGELANIDAPVPNGFTITTQAYLNLLAHGSLRKKIQDKLAELDVEDSDSLISTAEKIRTHILASPFPKKVKLAITSAYRKLSGALDLQVAVRPSITSLDSKQLPENASFAGQQETFLNIKGEEDLLDAVKHCWASLFSARSLFYFKSHGLNYQDVVLAITIQKMIAAENSGVMFTALPFSGEEGKILIEAVYGLGKGIVHGHFTPDSYTVEKENLEILEKSISEQHEQITEEGRIPISKEYVRKQKISDKTIKELAKWGKRIENHYKRSQDIEWAYANSSIYIVESRPLTTVKKVLDQEKSPPKKSSERPILLTGVGASPGIATGKVSIVNSAKELEKVQEGDILVAPMTDPDYVPAMKKAGAIVTDHGGITSHTAVISRELGLPSVMGTKKATAMLSDQETVTVDGETGNIYEGEFILKEGPQEKPTEKEKKKLKTTQTRKSTATKLYVNLSEPDLAEEIAAQDVDGVGLLRAEFVFASIGAHPRYMLEKGKRTKMVNKIYQGLYQIAKAFDPHPVIYRASDLKTNEYRNLEGGEKYEKEEPNPTLGFRGAARYIKDPEIFKLELEAIKKVRRDYQNVSLMVPFVRTPEELVEVKKIMGQEGLYRSSTFKLWMMVEVPANIIMMEKFLGVGIDGISIGTNDLTQLTLGVDRDNAKMSEKYDQLNEAVLWLVKEAIEEAHEHGITSSICGQAPSLYPPLIEKLIQWGITSVSVSPDKIEQIRERISQAERSRILGTV